MTFTLLDVVCVVIAAGATGYLRGLAIGREHMRGPMGPPGATGPCGPSGRDCECDCGDDDDDE